MDTASTIELWFRETDPAESLATEQPLIILHGLFGSSINWRSFAKNLCERRRVFTLDLRNHGASPHAHRMDYDLMAADVRAFMDKQGFQTAAWLGHSMGGKVAMRAALSTPERVSRLVVADIAPVVYQRDFTELLGTLLAIDLDGLTGREEANTELARTIPEQGLRDFLLQNLKRRDGSFFWQVNLQAIQDNLEHILGFPVDDESQHYRGETLFLRGERSDYILTEHEPAMRRLFPKLRMETVSGAGHWLHAEQPARVASSIKRFLRCGG